jgi:hypothetical protein
MHRRIRPSSAIHLALFHKMHSKCIDRDTHIDARNRSMFMLTSINTCAVAVNPERAKQPSCKFCRC